jgi:hypothetical protein
MNTASLAAECMLVQWLRDHSFYVSDCSDLSRRKRETASSKIEKLSDL